MATTLLILVLAAPAPRHIPTDTLAGAWKAKYWEVEGTLSLFRGGDFAWHTRHGTTVGRWSVYGKWLWLRWEREYYTTGVSSGYGGATDRMIQVRRGVWSLARWKTPCLFLRARK